MSWPPLLAVRREGPAARLDRALCSAKQRGPKALFNHDPVIARQRRETAGPALLIPEALPIGLKTPETHQIPRNRCVNIF
jgi:hypothetical protein